MRHFRCQVAAPQPWMEAAAAAAAGLASLGGCGERLPRPRPPGTELRAVPAPGYRLWASSAEHRGKVRAGGPGVGNPAGVRVFWVGLSSRGNGTVVTAQGRPPVIEMITANAPSSTGVCCSRAAGAGAAARRRWGAVGSLSPAEALGGGH